jgi:TolB-like protein/Tfp pilus assembly protein PilF
VFRVLAVYGAVGFVLLQVVELLVPALLLPEWTYRFVALLLIVGFPIAVVLAWAFESTPDGVRRTEPAARGELEAIAAQPAARRWPSGLLALAGAAVLIGSVWLAGRRAGEAASEPPASGAADASDVDAAGTVSEEAVLQLAYADLSEDSRPSIAVLPFVNMSSVEEQEYFADGMTEELLNALAKVRELRVAGRTSSFAYKGEDKDLRQIGDELGVRYLVEGSVRKQDDRLRITAQLIDAENSFHLWSETYDRTLDDVFAVQEEISVSIAEALEVSLGLSGDETLVIPTADLAAYDLYLAGQARMRERNEGVAEAVRLYRAAVSRDSGWAPAWAGLAQAQALVPYYSTSEATDGILGASTEEWESALAAAEWAARRALDLDPDNAAAEVALGNVLRDRRQWQAAERHYLRALEIDPDNVEAHQQYAEHLGAVGRQAEAARSAERGVELDPTSAIRNYVLGYILVDQGRNADAIAPLERAKELDPELLSVLPTLSDAYGALGDWDRAERVNRDGLASAVRLQGAVSESERAFIDKQITEYYGAMRNADGAALEACCARAIYPWEYALIGDIERALDALEKLAAEDPGYGNQWQESLWSPLFDGHRSDPRFVEAQRSVNLEGVEPRRAPPAS